MRVLPRGALQGLSQVQQPPGLTWLASMKESAPEGSPGTCVLGEVLEEGPVQWGYQLSPSCLFIDPQRVEQGCVRVETGDHPRFQQRTASLGRGWPKRLARRQGPPCSFGYSIETGSVTAFQSPPCPAGGPINCFSWHFVRVDFSLVFCFVFP